MVLLCRRCSPSGAVGIRSGTNAVRSHFRGQHKLRGKQLEQVLGFVASQAAKHTLNDPHTAELPGDHSLPIEGLPLLRGFRCTEPQCRFLTINKNNMLAHPAGADHELRKGDGRARWEPVILQSFCRGRYARYWIVDDSNSSESSDSSSSSTAASTPQSQLTQKGHSTSGSAVLQMVQGCEAEIKREADERRRLAEDEAVKAIDRESRWVGFMKWSAHLPKKARPMLLKAGQPPVSKAAEARLWSEEEAKANRRLRQLSASFTRVMTRCRKRLDRVPDDTLEWLASVDPAKPNGKPFGDKQERETMDRYCLCFERYLCYCVRVWALGRKKAKREHKARFTGAQWDALGEVVRRLDVVAAAAERDGEKMAEKGAEEEEEEDLDRKELDKAVFDFCICSLKQKLGRKSYDNPLLHFTAVLGIDRAGEGWIPSHSHTRFLAGFLWCGRVLMLEG
ncbi:hypothetical protein B0J13DRAFT_681771 [Dactylonectria estremocensis]|uniref:C2H2-type domain-containing protein n=1 Tax=Dactylonectria estremocensis TaxID=1079267 RepID=A0A9P9IA67_9HYPO|nr:hypothetical protein B0J13DRAFT_681771 [Dactylonectria estremocensis]